jgi:hypothetical protein
MGHQGSMHGHFGELEQDDVAAGHSGTADERITHGGDTDVHSCLLYAATRCWDAKEVRWCDRRWCGRSNSCLIASFEFNTSLCTISGRLRQTWCTNSGHLRHTTTACTHKTNFNKGYCSTDTHQAMMTASGPAHIRLSYMQYHTTSANYTKHPLQVEELAHTPANSRAVCYPASAKYCRVPIDGTAAAIWVWIHGCSHTLSACRPTMPVMADRVAKHTTAGNDTG